MIVKKAVLNRIKFGGKQSGVGDEMVDMISKSVKIGEDVEPGTGLCVLHIGRGYTTIYGAFVTDKDGNKKNVTRIELFTDMVDVVCPDFADDDFVTVLVQ